MRNAAIVAFLLLAASTHADCTLRFIEPVGGTLASNAVAHLRWSAVPGATAYIVRWTDLVRVHRSSTTSETTWPVRHAVLSPTLFEYSVTAAGDDASFVPCSAKASYVIDPDAAIARDADNFVIPIAGRLRGANGSMFMTRLSLRGAPFGVSCPLCPPQRGNTRTGRVVFHPAGRPGREDDPWVAYRLTDWQTVVFDDVMEAIGAEGLGWLEMIPDPGNPAVEGAEAWIVNLRGNERFGTHINSILGRDYFNHVHEIAAILNAPEQERISIGVLLLSGKGRLTARLQRPDGTAADGEAIDVDAKELHHVSLASIFPNVTPGVGDVLHIFFAGERGTTIGAVYLTTTDNETNDTEVLVSRRSVAVD